MTTQTRESTRRLPVLLVTGFLGAGKTTFVNYLLTEKQNEKVAVIVNEFGEIGVDKSLIVGERERIVELANGCLCCSVRGDLIDTLLTLWREVCESETYPLDRVVIETSGLADPVPIIQTLLRTPDIASRYELEGVLTLVDAKNFERQRKYLPLAEEQVACADLVVLNKTDLVSTKETADVRETLVALNPLALVVLADQGRISLDSVWQKKMFDADRFSTVAHSHAMSENHAEGIRTIVLGASQPLEKERFLTWLNAILEMTGPDMLRFKGRVHFMHDRTTSLLQGVHRDYVFTDHPASDALDHSTQIVFIGRNLDRERIERSWRENVIPPLSDGAHTRE